MESFGTKLVCHSSFELLCFWHLKWDPKYSIWPLTKFKSEKTWIFKCKTKKNLDEKLRRIINNKDLLLAFCANHF
jgi:hypothetical protein